MNQPARPGAPARILPAAEILLIGLFFFAVSATPAPDVNEAHYLAKAKHYWNPQWCPGDLFLDSADAHWTFYWTFGWLTRFASLNTVAWIGRILTWALLAWGWYRLSDAVTPGRFTAVLSAALFAALLRWGHMAGEWVLGGVEAKGFAYVLLLFAIESLVRDRWPRAIVFAGAAAAFHVLVGGWALVALGIAWLLSHQSHRPPLRTLAPYLLLAILLSLPGVIPGLALSWSADPAIVREANHIYVYERLGHHLVFHQLPHAFIARHAALMVTFLLLWKLHRGNQAALSGPFPRLVAAAMGIAVLGAILDQCLVNDLQTGASVLRYYWFRLSDVLTPLGVTFGWLGWQQQLAGTRPGLVWGLRAVLLLVVLANGMQAAYERWRDPRPGAVAQALPAGDLPAEELLQRWHAWQLLCDWIRAHTQPDDLFLTPRNQQTFKWDAHRPEVVNGKDVPQDAAGIVAWRRRMDDVFPYTVRFTDLAAHGAGGLIKLSRKYGFRYIILDRGASTRPLSLPRVYPQPPHTGGLYEVYQVPDSD